MKACFLFILSLLSLLCSNALRASELPDWMTEITKLPPGGHADLRPVKLVYTLSWNNRVNAGKVEISVLRDGTQETKFVGDASGKSTGFARVLWPYDFRARSIVDQDSLRPITFQLTEKERNEQNSYDIVFQKEKQLFNTTSKRKEESLSNQSSFEFAHGHDVLSSAFYLRSQPLNAGDKISMVVTPFNKPYLAKFEVIGKEKHKMKGKKFDAIRLDALVGKINPDLSIKRYEKIKQTSLWMSDDAYRIPLELQTHISVGFISARLIEMDWLD